MIIKIIQRRKISLTFLIISSFVLVVLFTQFPEDYYIYENKQPLFPTQCRNKFEVMKNEVDGEKFDNVTIKRHPNLPEFLVRSAFISSSIPDITRIRWNGIVYQESWIKSPKFLLYSAHFDSRSKSGLVVRILTLYDGEQETMKPNQYYCQFWFKETENPLMIHVKKIEYITLIPRYGMDDLNPYGITCQVPQVPNGSQVPAAVSLVKSPCQKTSNILKIFGSPLKKNRANISNDPKIGICGKALFYYNEDFSHRLIEWIEVMRILGVSKIFLYKTTCHKNVEKVLDFYEKTGFVKLVTFYYPPPFVQEGTFLRLWTKLQKYSYRKVQTMYLNDCILRNKDDFDYLGVFDSDEVPILKKHKTLQDFIKFTNRKFKPPAHLFLKWKHFYMDLSNDQFAPQTPENFYILRHNQRTKLNGREAKVIEENGKTLYDTSNAVWIACHYPIFNKLDLKLIDREMAYTAHYGKSLCQEEITCKRKELEEENTLLFYKERIIDSVLNISKQIL